MLLHALTNYRWYTLCRNVILYTTQKVVYFAVKSPKLHLSFKWYTLVRNRGKLWSEISGIH